jgi:diguanylate cyclase
MEHDKQQFAIATNNLKKTVPLLIQNQVPATPSNYALWYTYAANENPELTRALESYIQEQGGCGPAMTRELYNQHIQSAEQTNIDKTQFELDAMMQEIDGALQDTLDDTQAFHQHLDQNVAKLDALENSTISFEDMTALMRSLLESTQLMRQKTRFFANQLEQANGEIKQLKEQLSHTRKDALYDSLTNVLNRRAFDQQLQTLIHLGKEQPFCLLMVDIDKFKDINDTHGHQLGDYVLKAVAKRLHDSCREGTQIFRYGGEEFAILMPKANLTVGRQKAEALRRAIEKVVVMDRRSGKRLSNITISIGAAAFDPTTPNVVEQADAQLYQAKKLGRNRVMPFNV